MDAKKEIREKMPAMAAFLDDLASAFGEEAVWSQVEKGIAGEPTFFARENGKRIGTRNTVHTSVIGWDERGLPYSSDPDWMLEAREFVRRRGIAIAPYDPNKPGDVEREARELRQAIDQAKGGAK